MNDAAILRAAAVYWAGRRRALVRAAALARASMRAVHVALVETETAGRFWYSSGPHNLFSGWVYTHEQHERALAVNAAWVRAGRLARLARSTESVARRYERWQYRLRPVAYGQRAFRELSAEGAATRYPMLQP